MLLRDRVIDLVKKCGVPLIAKGGQNSKDYFGNLQDHESADLLKIHFEEEAAIICMNLCLHRDVDVEMSENAFFIWAIFRKFREAGRTMAAVCLFFRTSCIQMQPQSILF